VTVNCCTAPRSRERHTISYRMKDLERRVDPSHLLRLGRGTMARRGPKESTMPEGTHVAVLTTGQSCRSAACSRACCGAIFKLWVALFAQSPSVISTWEPFVARKIFSVLTRSLADHRCSHPGQAKPDDGASSLSRCSPRASHIRMHHRSASRLRFHRAARINIRYCQLDFSAARAGMFFGGQTAVRNRSRVGLLPEQPAAGIGGLLT